MGRGVLGCWLEPHQEFVVAEVTDDSAAFVSALAERVVAGPHAAYAQEQQRRMSPADG